MPETNLYKSLSDLLPHYSRAYNARWGESAVPNEDGKIQANYVVKREPLTSAVFMSHFQGVQAISVQPIVDGGNTCQWGALDIDDYQQGSLLPKVTSALDLFGFKYFAENSKSGGVHVYFLLDRPTLARPFRRALRKLAAWIGFPGAEIRPLQDEVKFEDHDVGTLMVLPGFGIGAKKALSQLSKIIMPIERFNELTDEGDWADGPPCLFPLRQQYSNGQWQSRNLFLYQLGVYFRFKFPSDWQDRLIKFNTEIISPPLDDGEVTALIGQLEKNDKCHYRCKDEPFLSVCAKSSCTMRRYGIKAKDSLSGVLSTEGVTVLDTDPPTWFVTLTHPQSGQTCRVKLSTSQLQYVNQFKKRCIEVLKIVPTLPKQAEWEALITDLLQSATVIPVPFEMTEHARLLDLLQKFCLTSTKSTSPEDLFKGRVWAAPVDGGMVGKFRLVDFTNFLERYRYKGVSSKDIYQMLYDLQKDGHIAAEKVNLDPIKLDVWSLFIPSKYFELKAEIDLENED